MFGAILKATNSSFQKCMTFCRSIYAKKVMKLLAFIFEQPSYVLRLSKGIVPQWMLRAGVPTKSDSDVIFCLQLFGKTFNLKTPLKLKRIDRSLVYYNTPVIYRL